MVSQKSDQEGIRFVLFRLGDDVIGSSVGLLGGGSVLFGIHVNNRILVKQQQEDIFPLYVCFSTLCLGIDSSNGEIIPKERQQPRHNRYSSQTELCAEQGTRTLAGCFCSLQISTSSLHRQYCRWCCSAASSRGPWIYPAGLWCK